ncbi:hypothetical protein [Methylobacterium terricola]|uniref:hypothetical protein n=1 Tax=Methylobacterium terricola TaxID=2583531 RepID=UPI0014873B4C|nr:hypothetical protein [Methylobacterium terricola]
MKDAINDAARLAVAANDAVTETDLIHIVHVKAWPFERLVRFGQSIVRFGEAYPDVGFEWCEADYAEVDRDTEDEDEDDADEVEDEDEDALVVDNVTVFPFDPDWATFLFSFKDQAGYDAWSVWRGGAR